MELKHMHISGRSLLIAALVGSLSLPSMVTFAAMQESNTAQPLRQENASVPSKWHDDTDLNLRPEQFEAYGLTGPEWESAPEARGAAGPLRQDDASGPKWHDDSGLRLRGAQFEAYGLTGWEWD